MFSFAQAKKELTKDEIKALERLRLAYALAIEIKDVKSAEFCMLQIVASVPEDTVEVLKLLGLYFGHQNYESVYLLSKKYTDKYRMNAKFLDFYAKSAELLGKNTEALMGYDKLYLLTNDSYYGYLAANAEYFLGRQKECLEHTQTLLTNKDLRNTFVTFDLGEGKTQDIVIEAALNNLKGVVLKELGRKSESESAFKQALKVVPDFIIASENLRRINE
jgi:tetratricopeptide (TPR) repeat protein